MGPVERQLEHETRNLQMLMIMSILFSNTILISAKIWKIADIPSFFFTTDVWLPWTALNQYLSDIHKYVFL